MKFYLCTYTSTGESEAQGHLSGNPGVVFGVRNLAQGPNSDMSILPTTGFKPLTLGTRAWTHKAIHCTGNTNLWEHNKGWTDRTIRKWMNMLLHFYGGLISGINPSFKLDFPVPIGGNYFPQHCTSHRNPHHILHLLLHNEYRKYSTNTTVMQQ